MTALPDLTPAELAALSQKYGLEGGLERLPSVGIVNRVHRAALTDSVAAPAAFHAWVRTPELLVFDDDRDVVDAPVTAYAFAPGRAAVWKVTAGPRMTRVCCALTVGRGVSWPGFTGT